jgi:hypothetical protein
MFLQMDLAKKFEIATACQTVSVGTLEEQQPYRIIQAERTTTQFGPTVALLLLINLLAAAPLKVFLPRRYASQFTDADVAAINEGRVNLTLTFEGICPKSRAYKLSIMHTTNNA